METQREKYINPFTDFGFKRLFGEEVNKDILLDFLNELLSEQHGRLKDLSYQKTEKFGRTAEERRAIFDIYCENEQGEKFLVEMQKTKQAFFKDRSLYYVTFPIQEQAERSEWNYRLNAVFMVGILDFVFDNDKHELDKYRYDIQLTDTETKRVFYDKLTFIYLEMPKFTKTVDQLETRFDKWMYVLKNLPKLDRLPDALREQIFERVFQIAEIAKMTKEEHTQYEDSLKGYRDLQNSLDTAKAEGEVIGEAKRTREVALNLIKKGLDNDFIYEVTGLSDDQLNQLRSELLNN